MDHLGAALGTGVAIALSAIGFAPERVFLLSAIPGFAAVVAIALARNAPTSVSVRADGDPAPPLPRSAWRFLGPVALFGLANATDAFVLLKLAEQGAATEWLPIAWLLLHAVKAGASYPAGWLADRWGPQRMVLLGWGLYAASYAGLAFSPTWQVTVGATAIYGLYHAMSEGAERSLLVSLVPAGAQGRAIGLYHSISGVAALVAGLAFGAVWTRLGSATAFLAAGATAAVAAMLLVALKPRPLAPLRPLS
jgi:MFS family permease